uniref:XRN2-binding (XTBD) domain-containing protein n=1 Tax=Caenorhabditis tropicalis TaxID=1561998 RepID=A0A1I7SZ56_9PELO
MLRPQTPQIHRNEVTDDERDYRTISGMQEKMHDYRMTKIRENLEEVRKTNWIYVGNIFRERSLAPSKP